MRSGEISMKKVLKVFKKQFILVIAFFLAIVSIIFVPIDSSYFKYFDIKTLVCLFLMMSVIGAFKNIKLFETISIVLIAKFKNTRMLVTAIVFITFFSSMVIANDMALLTFIPLSLIIFKTTKKENFAAMTIILQTAAANLGGMLTPFGNPQNLYLFSYYNIDGLEFMSIMLVPFLFSTFLLLVLCFQTKLEVLQVFSGKIEKLNRKKVTILCILFVISVLIVFNVIPFQIGFLAIVIPLIIFDYRSFKVVDYGLLFTFVAFFVFAGNLARIDFINQFMTKVLPNNELVLSILSCQMMSNVPSAILLSKFTMNYSALLRGVNIGGLGTPIASLASLIAITQYHKNFPATLKHFLKLFFIVNFSFVFILFFVCTLF